MLSRYKVCAYFNYIFYSETKTINKNVQKNISKIIKELIEDRKSEIQNHGFHNIKFHGVVYRFEDTQRTPQDRFRVYLLLTSKKQSLQGIVRNISDDCFKELKTKYPDFKIIPGHDKYYGAEKCREYPLDY